MIPRESKHHLRPPDIEPVKEFVHKAFDDKKRTGESFQYNHILQQLTVRDDPEMLWRVYASLADHVASLAESPEAHKELIHALFTFDWNAGENIVAAFTSLIGLLVSANPNFLPSVTELILRNLVEERSGADAALLLSRCGQLHAALRAVLSLAPSGQAGLHTILLQKFPYKTQSIAIQTKYVAQLLTMCQYLPHFQQRILDLIVTKCLEIDVSMTVDKSGSDSTSRLPEDLMDIDDMFAFDHEKMSSFPDAQPSLPASLPKLSRGVPSRWMGSRSITEAAVGLSETLDVLLVQLVSFLELHFAQDGPSDRDKLFFQLLGIFECRILTAHRSKFVQFLMFYVCTKHPFYASSFARRLLDIFLQPKSSAAQRQCAVMYLASFFCRFSACPAIVIRDTVLELVRWGADYSDSNKSTRGSVVRGGRVDREAGSLLVQDEKGALSLRHETLYLATQAVCSVICYFGSDLWLHLLALDGVPDRLRVMLQVLHPLNFALPIIRHEFWELASRPDVASRSSAPPFTKDELFGDEATSRSEQLQDAVKIQNEKLLSTGFDYFFPFEPCLLESMNSYIHQEYQDSYAPETSTGNKFSGLSTEPLGAGCNSEDMLLLERGQCGRADSLISSYESSVIPSVDLVVEELQADTISKPILRCGGSNLSFPDLTRLSVAGVPPLHPPSEPFVKGAEMPSGYGSSSSYRQQRRRRKIEDPYGETEVAGPAVDGNMTTLLVPDFPVQQRHTSGTVIPSFDNFAVPIPRAPDAGGDTKDSYKGPPNPALNDFQKRAREYSVGSVGSW